MTTVNFRKAAILSNPNAFAVVAIRLDGSLRRIMSIHADLSSAAKEVSEYRAAGYAWRVVLAADIAAAL